MLEHLRIEWYEQQIVVPTFILDMLIGRLEIFPILVLFSKSTWMAGKDKLKDKSSGREKASIAKLKTANYKTR